MQVSDVLLFGEVWSWFGAVVRGVFFAVAMGLGLAVQYRFTAAGRERAAVSRAVSAGVLPESADAEWRGGPAAGGSPPGTTPGGAAAPPRRPRGAGSRRGGCPRRAGGRGGRWSLA